MATSTIPMARGLPGIGSVFDMARDMRAFLTESYLEHGPVYRMRLLNQQFTVLAGEQANRFLARHGTKHFRSFEFWSGFNAWFGAARSTLSADGAEHAAFRRTLKRGYSREYAVERMDGMIDIARREIAAWPEGKPIPAVPALQRVVTDQVGTLVAGVSPRPYNDDLVCYVHGLLSATIVPRPYLRWSPRFRRASAQVDKLYHEVIECHSGSMRERHGAEPDLIDDLLNLHESDPKFFPEADLKIAAMGPFVAALDTVAGTCAFMLYALLRHPDVLERVRDEADALLTGSAPPEQALREMDAMHRAAMETMRMYPVTPLLVRTAANSFEFAGHRIPAGERVMIATAVPHYLPEFFPEPERFDIDRYGPERAEHKQPYVYAPFGLGPHRCLGNGFAEVQIATTMATVLHEVDLDLDRAGYNLKTTQIPMPAPAESFKVRVRGRRGAVQPLAGRKPWGALGAVLGGALWGALGAEAAREAFRSMTPAHLGRRPLIR
ncbi:MAG: cytochrome P450 [Rhodospirillales bacterium]|nr:cytochrome P450 [Rhodospirillales bacterium]